MKVFVVRGGGKRVPPIQCLFQRRVPTKAIRFVRILHFTWTFLFIIRFTDKTVEIGVQKLIRDDHGICVRFRPGRERLRGKQSLLNLPQKRLSLAPFANKAYPVALFVRFALRLRKGLVSRGKLKESRQRRFKLRLDFRLN